MTTTPILPGATLGVLGSGQLGRMFALAARRMGYRVHVFSPESASPTAQVADCEVVAAYEDLQAVRDFARAVAAVTIEFENIPSATLEAAAAFAPVRPGPRSLHITQHRRREREFLAAIGVPIAPFAIVRSENDLLEAVRELGAPGVLKTAGFGYDGKGQRLVKGLTDAASDWAELDGQECVYERFITFERELSVIVVRGENGETAVYEPFENIHVERILDLTVWPAGVSRTISDEAKALGLRIAEALEHVGVFCIEMFVTAAGEIIVNELAPRPHNSGHVTIEAAATSQFEQQVRALCGLPLGSTEAVSAGAMVQLLGDLWAGGEPDWAGCLAVPGAALHLYWKAEARAGRKMGHITALAPSPEAARERVLRARTALTHP